MKIDHIGIVVKDINGYLAHSLLMLDSQIFFDPLQQADICFLSSGEGPVRVELIAPRNDESFVYGFLQKSGGGLHHICYQVESMAAAKEIIEEKRMVSIFGPIPAVAFSGAKVWFAYSRNKEIIEFVEPYGES